MSIELFEILPSLSLKIKEQFTPTYKENCYISGAITYNKNAINDFKVGENYCINELDLIPINPIRFAEENSLLGNDKDNEYYSSIMIVDLMLLKYCANVLMLPNWQVSSGAMIEHRYAKRLSKKIYYSENSILLPDFAQHIKNSWNSLINYLKAEPNDLLRNKSEQYTMYRQMLCLAFIEEYKYTPNFINAIIGINRTTIYNSLKSAKAMIKEDFFKIIYNNIILKIVNYEYETLIAVHPIPRKKMLLTS